MSLCLLLLLVLYASPRSEAQTEGQVRLTGLNLTVKSSGRLEIFLNGEWGTVSRQLTDTIADLQLAYGKTVCYQINHYNGDNSKVATGTVTELNKYLKSANKPYHINTANSALNASVYDLRCENHFGKFPRHVLRCSYVPSNGLRNHDNDLAVICPQHGSNSDNPFIGQLRIVSGSISSVNEGTLEIYSGTKWGSICYEGFNQAAADTACRQLGYTDAKYFSASTSSAESTVWLDSLSCDDSLENQCLWHCLSKNNYKDLFNNKTKSCVGSAHVAVTCVFDVSRSNVTSSFIGNACQVPPYPGWNPVTGSGTEDNSGISTLVFGVIIGSVVLALLVCCVITAGVVVCVCCLVPSCYLYQQRNKTRYTRYSIIERPKTDDV